jgi:hypothetical protein
MALLVAGALVAASKGILRRMISIQTRRAVG